MAKKRNPEAAVLRQRQYKQKIVPNKKRRQERRRKPKHPKRDEHASGVLLFYVWLCYSLLLSSESLFSSSELLSPLSFWLLSFCGVCDRAVHRFGDKWIQS